MIQPAIKAIAPWFGCARMLAPEVGKLLVGCRWVGVPFAGGMPELAYIDAPTIVVGDVHRNVINLANCLRDGYLGPRLYRRLRRVPFCDDCLRESQEWCKAMGHEDYRPALDNRDVDAAYHYFVAVWMGRSAKAGTINEFNDRLPVRWNTNGGDSNTRYRAAVRSILVWRRILAKCNFLVQDCFDFLAQAHDDHEHGIYCDPPFPDTGAVYRHAFTEDDHRLLAASLWAFTKTRIVCRFYDHPLVRELYPESHWAWHRFPGRTQSNEKRVEVLLVNRIEDKTLF